MNDRLIRNILVGTCWTLSVVLTGVLASGGMDHRDLKMAEMLLKTKQCNLAGSIGADWQGNTVKITCWSGKVFAQRQGKRPRTSNGKTPI